MSTKRINFKAKTLDFEGKKIRLLNWDIPEIYRIRNERDEKVYYRCTEGIMLVYDITNLESFNNLNSWLIEIKEYISEDIYVILVGNKCDEEDRREVSFEQGKNFAIKNGM